jgi:hypothetical protein
MAPLLTAAMALATIDTFACLTVGPGLFARVQQRAELIPTTRHLHNGSTDP